MKSTITKSLIFSLFLLPLLLHSVSSPCQTVWLQQNRSKFLALELLKPNFEENTNVNFSTSIFILTGSVPVSKMVHLVGELSFVHVSFDVVNFNFPDGTFTSETKSENMFGNPYLGIEVGKPDANGYATLGIRVPVVPDNKSSAFITGLVSDFNRMEAYTPDIWTLAGRIHYQIKSSSGFVSKYRFGPTIWFNSDDFSGDNGELWLDYSTMLGYETKKFSVMGGLTGRLIVSEDELDFSERTFHQFGVAASIRLANFQPGLYLKVPLDDDLFLDAVDFVLGFNVGVQLK